MTAHDQTRPVRLFKGWWLLLAILAAMGVYVAANFLAGSFLDSDLDRAEAEPAIAEAKEWRAAWDEFGYAPAEEANEELDAAEAAASRRAWTEAVDLARSARQKYMDAFKAEAQLLYNEVLGPWRDELLPRFPFNPESAVDASLELVVELCNPENGRFPRGANRIEQLARIEIRGLQASPAPADFAGISALAERLRDVLFEGGSRPYLEFATQLKGDITLKIGDIEGKGGEFTTFRWEGEGARLIADGTEFDSSQSPWGPWRVLWHMNESEALRDRIVIAVEGQPSPLEQATFQP